MRTESDSMGPMQVPDEALYGASTRRAVLNFPVSGHPMPKGFLKGLGLVKGACARANEALGRLSPAKSALIQRVAQELAEGKWTDQFPVDVFQTGSGTSTNMNANEVIAHRALQLDASTPLHPNDDVNLGQSSNDIIPTVLHVSVALALQEDLEPALALLEASLEEKSIRFQQVVKIGRTHLMDATPLTLGQEFSGYVAQIRKGRQRLAKAVAALGELAVGGTAVGTGINGHPGFAPKVCQLLSEATGIPFREAGNHFEAQAGRDDAVEVAGHLATLACSLTKIANDLRLLGSGPRAGLGELRLPPVQPGSSIMPGKTNPVMCEMMVQVCLYVQGLTHVVVLCGREGQFELNVTLPLMAHALHESVYCLANAVRLFAVRCVEGLEADAARCRELTGRSLMLVTALTPFIGYDQAAAVAKEALHSGRTLREVVLEKKLMEPDALDRALNPETMIQPGA